MKVLVLLAVLAVGAFAIPRTYNKPGSRIHNGELANAEDVPYQVALYIEDSMGGASKCGGALISKRLVLSSANCFSTSQSGTAYFGSNKYREGVPVTFSRVDVHDDFDPFTHESDIALVHLDEDIEENGSTIKYISLDREPLQDKIVIASGFGMIDNSEDTNDLYYAPLSVMRNNYCREYYGEPFFDYFICCIGEELQSTCNGDFGGPVVRNWPENPVHVGIITYGIEACGGDGDAPVVFTRTADFIDWIEEHSD